MTPRTRMLVLVGLLLASAGAWAASTGYTANQIYTGAPTSLTLTASSNVEGTGLAMARADHQHAVTGTLGAAHGGTGQTAATTDGALVCNGTTCPPVVLPSCSGSTSMLQYNTASHIWACGTSTTGSVTSVTGTPPITSSGGFTPAIGLDLGAGGSLAVSASKLVRAALTGDATASSDSNALTLATVNASPGSYGAFASTLFATVNGKGLVTSLSAGSIAIDGSQITSGVVSPLNGGTGAVVGVATGAPWWNAGTYIVASALPAYVGGTGDTALTNHGVVLGSGGAPALGVTAVGATNTLLHGNTAADPSYSAVVDADFSGQLSIAHGGTGAATAAAGTVFGNNTASSAAPAFQNTILLRGSSPQVTLGIPSSVTGGVKFQTSASSGTTTLAAGDPGPATDITITLPPSSGLSGQTVRSNGSGALTFGTLGVVGGGTGLATHTQGAILTGGSGTAAMVDLTDVATGSLLVSGGTSTIPAWSATSVPVNGVAPQLILGAAAGSSSGRIDFKGSSSGTAQLTVATAAGTPTITLPTVTTTEPTAQPAADGYALTATTSGLQSYGILGVAAGGNGAAPGGADQVLVATSTTAGTWRTLPSASGTGQAVTYNTSTDTFGTGTFVDTSNAQSSIAGTKSWSSLHTFTAGITTSGSTTITIGGSGGVTVTDTKFGNSCTTSGGAATTCTMTVRSGCSPVCSNGGTTSASLTRAVVASTTLTCTFPTSGTNNICYCLCY